MPISFPIPVKSVLELIQWLPEIVCSTPAPHVDWKRISGHQDWLVVLTTSCYALSSCTHMRTAEKNWSQSTASLPVIILNISIKSPLILLSSGVVNPNCTSLSSWGSWWSPRTILVAAICTLSKHSISFFKWGDYADIVLHRRSDIRFVYEQKIIFIESSKIPAYHPHNWSCFGYWPNTLCTGLQLFCYMYTSTVCSIAMLFLASSCTWVMSNVHDLAPSPSSSPFL